MTTKTPYTKIRAGGLPIDQLVMSNPLECGTLSNLTFFSFFQLFSLPCVNHPLPFAQMLMQIKSIVLYFVKIVKHFLLLHFMSIALF